MANHLRAHPLDGYSVWLVFFDGEEAVQEWSRSDSLYGSRHLAAKWQNDGTLKRIKAFLLADMIGDKNLDIDRDHNSTPWVLDVVKKAATHFGYQSYFFAHENQVEDDHLPFVQRGVPSADIIDLDYGPQNSYHHTAQDTMDKLSAKSLTIVGNVFLETIRLSEPTLTNDRGRIDRLLGRIPRDLSPDILFVDLAVLQRSNKTVSTARGVELDRGSLPPWPSASHCCSRKHRVNSRP